MVKEIERKFLVVGDAWRAGAVGTRYRQGYLSATPDCTVRVRIGGDKAFLTIKGASQGISRDEFEYSIPAADAEILLDTLCRKPLIEKTRHKLPVGNLVWEIDEFSGDNQGLIMAELELPSEDTPFDKPDWVGEDVTGDLRYYNVSLVENPYSKWRG